MGGKIRERGQGDEMRMTLRGGCGSGGEITVKLPSEKHINVT